jgi:TolA-binding protein
MKKGLKRTDIDTYLQMEDEQKKRAFEKNVSDEDFDRDAVDGYHESGLNTSALRDLDRKFAPRSMNGWIIVSSSILLVAIISILLISNKTDHSSLSMKKEQLVRLDRTEVILPPHIDSLTEIPINTQIQAKQLVKDFIEQKEHKEQKSNEESFTEVNLKPIPISDPSPIDSEFEIIEKKQVSGKELFLHDLKLIDYRAYRSKPKVKTEQLILTGIPADLESGNSTQESEWQTIDIPYMEYIERSMELFSKGNFKKALGRFEVILKTYPDDINALFYAGLCYYNLKNTNDALSSFEKCLSSNYNNFNEEAEWYYALSLILSGESERAVKVLQRITTSPGYYAEQARKKLSTL